jgi:predicted adenylyl cyclase CyaB
MLEIEIKARVADPTEVRRNLERFMEYGGEVDKRDSYWSIPVPVAPGAAGSFRFRIRREPGQTIVTFKEKSVINNLEVNREVEFGIVDESSFELFIKKMNAVPLYTKRKKGTLWKGSNGLIAELVDVEKLGNFLEVEILQQENEELDTRKLRKLLLSVVERGGLKESDLDERPYSQLLGIPRY